MLPEGDRPEAGASGGTSGSSGTDGLVLEDITVTFGGLTALSEVSLAVGDNRVHGVIGPNGAGKTTLFNVACGFTRPDSGHWSWRGRRLTGLRPHDLAGLGIARTLQGVGLFDRMSVVENVIIGTEGRARSGFFSSLLGLTGSAREERRLREESMAALDSLHISEYADQYPPNLPYPIRKRVSLARALVARPALLLLDEPASGLSQTEMDELADLIRSLTEEMSILLVEHHMDLVMSVCDDITVLDFGRVIAHGPPAAVKDDPAVLAAYLGDPVEQGG